MEGGGGHGPERVEYRNTTPKHSNEMSPSGIITRTSTTTGPGSASPKDREAYRTFEVIMGAATLICFCFVKYKIIFSLGLTFVNVTFREEMLMELMKSHRKGPTTTHCFYLKRSRANEVNTLNVSCQLNVLVFNSEL